MAKRFIVTILLTSDSIRRKDLLQQVGFRDSIAFEMAGMPVDFHYHNKKERLTLPQVKEKVVAGGPAQGQKGQLIKGNLCRPWVCPLNKLLLVGARDNTGSLTAVVMAADAFKRSAGGNTGRD